MLGNIQWLIYLALAVVLFAVELWGLVDALRRPSGAFAAAGKRSKAFWAGLTAAGAAIGFLALPFGAGIPISMFFMFLAVVPAMVYLTDVRPAISPYSGGGRRPPRRGGGW